MIAKFSRRSLVVVGSLAGIALFAYTVREVSLAAVLTGVKRVGEGFWLILLVAGLRLAARAAAWTACAGGPSRLPFSAAFAACIVGEAAGNVTPFGPAASEPAKVLWVRHRVGTVESAASLAVETLVYSLTVAAMLTAGTLAWIGSVAPATALRVELDGLLIMFGGALLLWVTRRRWLRLIQPIVGRLEASGRRKPGARFVSDGLRRSVEILRTMVARRPATLAVVALCEAVFQAAAVGEVWLMLVLLGIPEATLFHAFLLEYANRVVTVVFKFVPMRLGVDELASGAMAAFLGSGGPVGVTLALVRKARVLCWSVLGLGLAGARAFSLRGRRERAAVPARPDEVAP